MNIWLNESLFKISPKYSLTSHSIAANLLLYNSKTFNDHPLTREAKCLNVESQAYGERKIPTQKWDYT